MVSIYYMENQKNNLIYEILEEPNSCKFQLHEFILKSDHFHAIYASVFFLSQISHGNG